ncbi:MAG: efflux RND transporter periplasmic adaptor subunit [Rhodocyclaceae bacterium]|nr:efflux RND transporter periplasmic adaptor subunit [Rhodocyclaceae bacterium]
MLAPLLLAGLAGIALAAEPPGTPPAARPAPAASTASANLALENREIRAQLLPRRYTTLAAEIGAKVKRLPVPEGGRFRAGEILVALDCSIQQAQLQKAKAMLYGAEQTWHANKRLSEMNSVGKVELDVSEAEVNKAQAEVNANAAVIAKCNIPAPYPGRVADQKIREQQYVQPGQALLDILDDSVLELEFIVPSGWLAWIRPGYGFKVRIDETDKSYPAKIQRIGARVDPVSQSVKLSAAIDGKFPELIAGMSGKVTLTPPEYRK